MAEVRAVSVAQVRDAAARLEAVLGETKRWASTSWTDALGRGYDPGYQEQVEAAREQTTRAWLAGQHQAIERYLNLVLGLDPQWFQDQAAACSTAESLIRSSIGDPPAQVQHDAGVFTEALASVERNLVSWQGEAAEAFDRQVQRIRDFDDQQAGLRVALGLSMIGGRDAVMAARSGFVAVCEDAIAAAAAYRATESGREDRVARYLLVGIVVTACALVAAGAAPGGIGLATYVLSWAGGGAVVAGQAISTGNAVALTAIPSSDLDTITAGFAANQDRVIAALDDEMTTIADKCAQFDREYGPGSRLLIPLPTSTDVHAPAYTYDNFRSRDHPPSPGFDAAIRAAARLAPAPAGDGRISRALKPER